ncbi:MAG: Omp28-related outer membrane protein [Bacteroidota bacterium]
MKRSLFVICSAILFLSSCEEKAPLIIFKESAAKDTTYLLSTVPGTEAHNVLIEEYTGQSCSNCPAAHVTIEGYIHAKPPGRINVIGLYNFGIQQTVPPNGSHNDFRDSTATDIGKTIYGTVGQIPTGGVDRVAVAGRVLLNTGEWANVLNTRLDIEDSLNLKVTSSWDAAKGEATITALITYTKPVSGMHNLSLVLVEDGIVDIQEYPAFDPNFPSGHDEDYDFTNVFRDMITAAPWGDPLLPAQAIKEPGRVIQKVYTYKPKTKTPAIKPENCKVVAFVNGSSSANLRIYQSVQTKLKP